MPSDDWDGCSEVFPLATEGMAGFAFEVYNCKTRKGRSFWFESRKQTEAARDRWIEYYLDCVQSKTKGAA